jgi:hypothetical protein
MAVVQGIKEKVHLPIYDCVRVDAEEQLRDVENSSTLKFFIDVQGKTKLETNLQSASLLPHYNTFEARALRVVVSDLPPEYPDDGEIELTDLQVLGEDSNDPNNPTDSDAKITLTVKRAVDLLQEALAADDGNAQVDLPDPDVTGPTTGTPTAVLISADDLEAALDDDDTGPPAEQYLSDDGTGAVLSKFVYNTVTSLYVGEKLMIEMPTWFFPSGAGPFSDSGKFSTHGEPNPTATFRFAEPIFIDKQQNFRVEIEVPHSEVLVSLKKIYGPLFIWVVLDGYMTRGVQ